MVRWWDIKASLWIAALKRPFWSIERTRLFKLRSRYTYPTWPNIGQTSRSLHIILSSSMTYIEKKKGQTLGYSWSCCECIRVLLPAEVDWIRNHNSWSDEKRLNRPHKGTWDREHRLDTRVYFPWIFRTWVRKMIQRSFFLPKVSTGLCDSFNCPITRGTDPRAIFEKCSSGIVRVGNVKGQYVVGNTPNITATFVMQHPL